MKCNEIKSHLGAFLDEQPFGAERLAVERLDIESHLQRCQSCLSDFNQLKIAKEQLAAIPAPQLSDQFDDNLAAKIAEFEQQRPHCQTLNGHVASNVVAFKPRQRADELLNTASNVQANEPADKLTVNQPINQRSPIWQVAATVTFTALGLTWLALSVDSSAPSTPSEPQIALEENLEIIEIETFDNINRSLESLPILTAVDSPEDEIYWSDVEVEQFDQYTQLDDGYRSFNCGSSGGERGCALAADTLILPLTVTKI